MTPDRSVICQCRSHWLGSEADTGKIPPAVGGAMENNTFSEVGEDKNLSEKCGKVGDHSYGRS